MYSDFEDEFLLETQVWIYFYISLVYEIFSLVDKDCVLDNGYSTWEGPGIRFYQITLVSISSISLQNIHNNICIQIIYFYYL